jgi:hypothetical protein
MITTGMDSHIHYRHERHEVARLAKAVEPMMDHIRAVATNGERASMHRILNGTYFRRWQALSVKRMLEKACKYARAHLEDYFPIVRESVMAQTEELENALVAYWANFEFAAAETLPTD